jgi:transcriptional regulator with XRE-family HTH domain
MEYATALTTYLKQDGANQAELAEKVGCTQPSMSRYSKGERLPPREVAERIDKHTDGQVPLSLWISAAAKKFGLAA